MEKTGRLFLSLNFEGAEIPRRICLVPPGETVIGRDGRSWKNKNPKQTVLNSMARLPKLPIDENHATDLSAPKGGASPAFGWITALCADGQGAIVADVEWTPRGKEAVTNKEYAFISPVFLYSKEGEIDCILRAGLTNTPNLRLPALNSEQPDKNNTEETMDKALCAALGIAEGADVKEALAAIEKLKTAQNAESGKVDLQVYAPRAELNAAKTELSAALEKAVAAEKRLAELNAEAFKKEAESAVDEAIKAGKFPPASRDTCLALCADKTGLEKFKELAAKGFAVVDGRAQVPETAPPGGSGGTALNADESAVAKAMGYSVEEYQKIKEAGK